MALNKATLKSIGRSVLGVAVGVVIYFSGEPKYAALGAIVPFLLRWVDPTEKEITFGKTIAADVAPATPATPAVV